MKKKMIRVLLILSFAAFTFFYTHKGIELFKNMDPIMEEIKKEKSKYEQPSRDATVMKDQIIPGYSGILVDIDKSYVQMKKMNKYNQNYYVYKIKSPEVSIKNNYDKYITKGNYLKNEVSFVFSIRKENNNLLDIYQVLEDKNIYGTFFVDGIYIKEHPKDIITLEDSAHEVEALSYNNQYKKEDIMNASRELESIINRKGNYCFIRDKNIDILNSCMNNKMYTVIPSFIVNTFSDLKNNLESGSIIEINIDKLEELSTYINYVKQKGYTLVTLSELLSENRTMEK